MSNETINQFYDLTEIEINSTLDVMKADPEKNSAMGHTYIIAINRCRQILEILLKDKKQ